MGYIPNALTLLNLSFGMFSLLYLAADNYHMAAIFILLAAVMDGVDGRVARYLKVASELGKQMDSLSDLVSFGVAPALLVYVQTLRPAYAGYVVDIAFTLLFVLCGAFRLARFNVLNTSGYFVGIPITLAGGLVGLLSLSSNWLTPSVFLIVMPLLSFLMVSNLKVRKL